MQNRNNIFDAIKAFAIWLVVFGHCIQYLSGVDFWNNKLFQLIYSFHMPLFFMISGFFFTSSIKLGIKDFLLKKSVSLLLPCFIWAIIYAFVNWSGIKEFFLNIAIPSHWPFWFFKGLFIVQLLAYLFLHLSRMIFPDDELGGVLIASLFSLIVYFLPYMAVPRVMIPIFFFGYLMRLYYEKFVRYYRVIGFVALLLFCGLFYFWNAEVMHYSAGASVTIYGVILGKHGYNIHHLLMLLYRIVIGSVGSLAVISLMHEIRGVPQIISKIGMSTAGIYIIQTLILERILSELFKRNVISPMDDGMCLIMSVLVCFASFVIFSLLNKNKILSVFLFGSYRRIERST